MDTLPVCFTAELADVSFEVRCIYPQTKERFRDYLTKRVPEFTVDTSDDEYIKIRDMLYGPWFRSAAPVAVSAVAENGPCIEEDVVHWMLDRMLSPYGVFHLHSSAVSLDGEAYLFTAPSGTGKSTHTGLWREAFGSRTWMINDDMPYLRITGSCVRAFGTPWMGKHIYGCNGSAPVRAIAWLTRDPENHMDLLPKADAFPVIMKETFALPEKEWVARLAQQVKTLLDLIPVYRLRCNMEPEAAYVSMRAMKLGELR